MTRDEVIRLAREAADPETADPLHNDMVTLMVWELERFATLVAAAEREACAAQCDAAADRLAACPASTENRAAISALRKIAASIRANSKGGA